MQTTFTIRQFKPVDLERVIYINGMCLPENYSSVFFLDLYERCPETFVVAEEDNVIVGYAMCRIERSIPSFRLMGLSKKGHLISIAVLPKYQHQGIGEALLKEIMKAMVDHYDAKEMYLEVRVTNTVAIGLYKKLDFYVARTLQGYYSDGENAYLMSRKLPFE
jgi:ribosomal-protein-alanine N-acetyltransferase